MRFNRVAQKGFGGFYVTLLDGGQAERMQQLCAFHLIHRDDWQFIVALRATRELADRLHFSLDELRYEYPSEVTDSETPAQRLERLAEADAFSGMQLNRRDALWAVRAIRAPKPLPRLALDPSVTDIDDFRFEHIKLLDYQHHPAIRAPIAV